MKNVVRALICFAISLIVLNCTNDQKMPVQGKVQFAVGITSKAPDGGRLLSTSFPDGAYILLSIETASGVSVYTFEHVDLIKLGDGYVTAPLDLMEGNYRLTDLMVFSKEGVALYVTPKEGSDLASLVTDPLPVSFSVTGDGITNLEVQVVDVDQQTPQDFGYISFGVEVVGGDYAVSLFIADGDELSLASGKLEIYQGNDLMYEQDLDAKVNPVNFKGNPDATYKLVVLKAGYAIKTRMYVLHDLVDELVGKPLVFVTEPAFTLTVVLKPSNSTPYFSLRALKSNIKIDWGDGVVEYPTSYTGTEYGTNRPFFRFPLSHIYTYSEGVKYYINITGDVESIYHVGIGYELPFNIKQLDFANLPNLERLELVVAGDAAPQFVDLSKNPNLFALDLNASKVERIDLSNNRALHFLDVSGTAFPENEFIEVIDHLHAIISVNNIRSGYFVFFNTPYIGSPPITPLSEESRLKLIDLRDNYNWVVIPPDF